LIEIETHEPNFAGVGDVAGDIKEIAAMKRTRAFVTTGIVVLVGIAASGVAFAQTQAAPPAAAPAPAASTPASSKPSATTQIETWTKKRWDAAVKEWAKDKAKWADCRKQSKAQKLSGQKNWSLLYQCMTS
jgi:hypothetical protein